MRAIVWFSYQGLSLPSYLFWIKCAVKRELLFLKMSIQLNK